MLLTHERVVQAVMKDGAVLPLRFGTMLDGEKSLEAVLVTRRDDLLRALARVRGRVEIGVRALARNAADAAPPGREHSGREYMLTRLREHRRAEEAARTLHAPLAALSCDSRLRAPTPPPARLASTYLVDRVRIAEFRTRVEELAARHEDLEVVVTGPWPPYSFVGEVAAP
jgi:hypothetical protein